MSDNDWSFEEDFTHSEPVSTGRPPSVSGAYHVRIGVSEVKTSDSGNDRVRWTDTILEGDFAGCEIFDGISIPSASHKDGGDFARRLWVNLLVSVGNDRKKVQKKLKINKKKIEGKECWILYTTKEDTGGDYAEVQHITKARYDKLDKPEAKPEGFKQDTGGSDFPDDDDGDDGDPLDDI